MMTMTEAFKLRWSIYYHPGDLNHCPPPPLAESPNIKPKYTGEPFYSLWITDENTDQSMPVPRQWRTWKGVVRYVLRQLVGCKLRGLEIVVEVVEFQTSVVGGPYTTHGVLRLSDVSEVHTMSEQIREAILNLRSDKRAKG